MQNQTYKTLEFDVILDMLKDLALSKGAKARALALEPIGNETLLKEALRETDDARNMMEQMGAPPLAIMEDLREIVAEAALEGLLTPAQLTAVAVFINTCRRMAKYLKDGEVFRIELSLNGRAFMPLEDIQYEIENAIRSDEVNDGASNALRDIRRKIAQAEEQVKVKLNHLLNSKKEYFADRYVAVRGGRQTLPVKAQYKAMVRGPVIDRSQTGGTLFIEPESVRAAQEEVFLLKLDEENEIRRILYMLTAMVSEAKDALNQNMKLMERLDFAFAKGKLSLDMKARSVSMGRGREMRIRRGVHPLLNPDTAVPLNFEIGIREKDGEKIRGVIITGPNTGGKTVALKTIGLFCLMAQSGLHIPTGEGTELCMHNAVLTDIGDGQSIAENLSTFSAHMTKVLEVLRTATDESLVLLDELGSGTDPAEGMGLAVAILEELAARRCLFVVTTHYPEIKEFADHAPGLQNARMTFDAETLKPLYALKIGEAGESCALHIAKRLGFPEVLIDRARQAAYSAEVRQAPTMKRATPAMSGGKGTSRLTQYAPPKQAPERASKFQLGDSVRVYPEGQNGIICKTTNVQGILGVQMKGKKKEVPYKRLKLIAPAEAMYPEDYDFSVIFDTVENRKARHQMGKRHDPGLVVQVNDDYETNPNP